VLTASRGEEALALCRAQTAAPTLLITDVVMPGMSGPTLVEALRDLYPDLRVLFLSGYADDAVLRHGALPRGAWFQQKPFALDALVRRVRDIIDASAEPRERAS
jgi:DNA-binding NarL/FixJ family response regulator